MEAELVVAAPRDRRGAPRKAALDPTRERLESMTTMSMDLEAGKSELHEATLSLDTLADSRSSSPRSSIVGDQQSTYSKAHSISSILIDGSQLGSPAGSAQWWGGSLSSSQGGSVCSTRGSPAPGRAPSVLGSALG